MTAAGARALPMAELEEILERACGLAFARGSARCVADGFVKAARGARAGEDAFLARLLAGDQESIAALVENAVVGETYFFRHPEQLEAVRRLVVDPAPKDVPLSIWSAGCATGEEPYTLAMTLLDAGRAEVPDRVLATDVSERALEGAAAGIYGAWSLRRIDPGARARHFEGRPPREAVVRDVRERVAFLRHNLVHDPAPGDAFDLVVCRNVLIYFRPDEAARVVAKLFGAVRPGGVLVLGPVETPVADGLGAQRLDDGAATLLRKPLPGEVIAAPPPRPEQGAPRARRRERTDGAAPARFRGPAVAPPGSAPAPAPARTAPPAPEPEAPRRASAIDLVREATRRGDEREAERIAREAAARDLSAECYLYLSMAAEARGDLAGAVDAARRALYLEPDLAMAHAELVALYRRLGRGDDAARARRNALRAIESLDDGAVLRAVEPITAGALRAALAATERPAAAAQGSRP